MRPFRRPVDGTLRVLALLAAGGGAVFLAGLLVEPGRAWAGFLAGFQVLVGLALAGPLFLAFLFASRARWADPLHPVLEAMGSALPAAGAAGLVLLLGIHSLYEWSHEAVVATDPVLRAKAAWLSAGPFALRTAACLAAWILLSRWLVAGARPRAGEGPEEGRRRRTVRAAVFLLVFTVTFSAASVDWLMSLEPHWFSTIFALQALAGLALAGLAAGTILVVHLRRTGPLAGSVGSAELRDLGTLLFSFSVFWAYIGYCQWMLIWYTNIPEETSWFETRTAGTWGLLSHLSLVLNGAVPFLALLARRARDSETVLVRVAAAVLAGRVVEVLVVVGPPLLGTAFPLDAYALAPVGGALALFFLLALRRLAAGAGVAGAESAFRPGPGAALHG